MQKSAGNEKSMENVIMPFDAAAYRRLYLPWLLGCILASLLIDAALFCFRPAGVQNTVLLAVRAFFFLINQLVFKAYVLYRYFHNRRIRALSFVRLEKRQVAHYIFKYKMPCRQAQTALDKELREGKQEFVSSRTFYIKDVGALRRTKGGGISAKGTIIEESLSELSAADGGFPKDGRVRETIGQHKISGYYRNMDKIYNALERLKK